MTTLNIVREINDDISRKYGLPIIQEREEQSMEKKKPEKIWERYVRDAGLSWKEQMRQDFDACINTAGSYEEWRRWGQFATPVCIKP